MLKNADHFDKEKFESEIDEIWGDLHYEHHMKKWGELFYKIISDVGERILIKIIAEKFLQSGDTLIIRSANKYYFLDDTDSDVLDEITETIPYLKF